MPPTNYDPVDNSGTVAYVDNVAQPDCAATELEVWMQDYGTAILRTAFLLSRDRQLAEDISQETFWQAHRKREQLRDPGCAKAWLLQIALNLCRQEMRKMAKRRTVVRPISEEEWHTPNDISCQRMNSKALYSIIQELPYKYREVIVLYYYHSLSIEEIAVQLNERKGTVKSKLSRGRKLLEAKLVEEEWTDAQF